MARIYTKTGDDGSTALGGGTRVLKNDIRVEAYGTVDELNSFIGLAAAHGVHEDIRPALERIQSALFDVGADLAFSNDEKMAWNPTRITQGHVVELEQAIDRIEARLPALANFILPGGSPSASALHCARAICRRAERLVVPLVQIHETGRPVLRYLNRLSDLLFVFARFQNHVSGMDDPIWKPES